MIIAAFLLFFQVLSQQGAQAMRDGRFADAERIYRQMLKEDPNDPRLRMNLGLALHSRHRYSDAVSEFRAFLKANPQPGPAHLMLGAARLKPCLPKNKDWTPAFAGMTKEQE